MPIVSSFEPAAYSGTGANAAGLPLNPNDYPDFRLMFHPKRWRFNSDIGEWLPFLAPIHLVPGISAVDKDGGTSLAFAEMEQRGYTVLRDGSGIASPAAYVAQYDTQPLPSGKVPKAYMPKWMVPVLLAGAVVVKHDPEAEVEYLRALVKSGRIPALEDDVKDLLRAKVQDEHDRDAGESTADGKAKARAEAAADILTRMDAADAGEPVAPKVKAGARKAAK
jgi:hypothetical protein